MNHVHAAFFNVVLFLSLFFLAIPTKAQDDPRFYVGADLGALIAPEVRMAGNSNDRASICDEFINPLFASVPGCTDTARGQGDGWEISYGGASGLSASAVFGYRLHRLFRIEAEYFFRSTKYEETAPVGGGSGATGDKLDFEILVANERLGLVASGGFIGNVYLDVPGVGSRLTPFVGLGFGLTNTRADYTSVWSRNPNPDAIDTGRDQPNADQIIANLAGSTSVGAATMTDTQPSLQVLLGFSYPVREGLSIDVRARWVTSTTDFEGEIVWDPLRSHVPNLRADGSEPVNGFLKTSDFSFVGVSIGMRHHF